MEELIPLDRIVGHIHLIRGVKVMLGQDLAALYGVETRHLVQAVKRHQRRPPMILCLSLHYKRLPT